MKLSELMAAVRMTPIKEREEEEGLGETEVAIDCCEADNSARKRTVERQEDEIRQYEAMLREEEEERRQQAEADTAVELEDDCFRTPDELELELSGLQQLSLHDDDRRSSMFAAIPPPTLMDWTDSEQDRSLSSEEVAHAADDETELLGSNHAAEETATLSGVEESEIELQQPSKLATLDELHREALSATAIPITDADEQLAGSVEPCEAFERSAETAAHATQIHGDSQPAEQLTSIAQTVAVPLETATTDDAVHVAELVVVQSSELDRLASVKDDECALHSPASPPPSSPASVQSPCPSCAACISLQASLQQVQTSSQQLHGLVEQLTSDNAALRSSDEKQRLTIQRLAGKERETEARLQKEDEDYKSLYFAYCQLERQYNALRATSHVELVAEEAEAESDAHDGEDEEQEVEQLDVTAVEEVDYAAMIDEKVVLSVSPQPSLVEQLNAELQQLESDKAQVEAQEGSRLTADEAETVELDTKYERPQTEHIEQSDRLAEALQAVMDAKLAQAQQEATNELRIIEKDDHIQRLDERISSLETTNQQLTADLHTQQQQLDAVQSQLRALDAEKQQLVTDLSSQQTDVQQLQAQLYEQRDTAEYAQNEKLALEQELSDLHTAHNSSLVQHTNERAQYESLLAQQQQKDADMLSVVDDSIANIEQLRTQLANSRLAFSRCQHTLLEQWDEQLVRHEELYAVRLELQQTSVELAGETERVVAMAVQLTQADGMRAALESRLRCSEDRVEELTALMATVEHDRRKDKLAHSTLTTQLSDADRLLDEQKQKHRELAKQLRHAEDRAVRLDGDIAMHEQKYVRLQSELQRERDERRREIDRRRETEAQLDQLQQHTATLEGQQEALTQSIQLRPLGVTDEYERRLRDKEALILRLGKTVKQMHRHIEVDVAQREAELARTIRQMQRLFVLVVRILSKPQYADDNEVRRLLEVLDRESAVARATEGKEREEVDAKAIR